MKTEAELIQLLLDSEDLYKNSNSVGFCRFIYYLRIHNIITLDEEDFLFSLIIDNAPKETFSLAFIFEPHQWQPRKEFLQQLLIKYKK
jgi:hypothetical protein